MLYLLLEPGAMKAVLVNVDLTEKLRAWYSDSEASERVLSYL